MSTSDAPDRRPKENGMRAWAVERKIAATLFLLLLGLGVVAGAANVALVVGTAPNAIEKRYAVPSQEVQSDPMAILDDPRACKLNCVTAHSSLMYSKEDYEHDTRPQET